ncbi:MAG: hypothetical protein Ta2G_09780 [Termitinemataceae bacterium]|nr:MAG: hypothetical protein Ta2G_09780 [Termitinemataceae bacterium]
MEVEKLGDIIWEYISEYFVYPENGLKKLFKFEFNLDEKIGGKLFDEVDKKKIFVGNWFENNFELKKVVTSKISNTDKHDDYHKWIVNEWGGIRSFQNFKLYDKFTSNFDEGKLTAKQFDSISSLSKIASFEHLEDYFIYDSRIATTLNWILLKSSCEVEKYFPIPEGRNSKFKYYSVNTIITLKYKDKKTEDLFYTKDEVYILYCKLIKKIYEKYRKEIDEPVFIEMLLFSLFENTIDEIHKSVEIIVK